MPVDNLVTHAKLVLENIFFEFGLNLVPRLLIYLWVYFEERFWILASLKLGFGGVFG